MDPSGLRLGTAATTSRGFKEAEMAQIAGWMGQVAAAPDDEAVLASIATEVKALCANHPAPGIPA
jgi:glycine hydroxymethyltransferase